MIEVSAPDAVVRVRDEGTGPAIVMIHGLGLDHSGFDGLAARLDGHRIVRPDLRGHGASDVPIGPYSMGRLVSDIELVMDTLEIRDAVVLGLSLGGMIAQGLAVKRLDLVRGLVLCSTAAKIGQPAQWHDRAEVARTQGMAALIEPSMKRWGGPEAPAARTVFLRTDPDGYAGGCAAIAGTDFYTPTSGLRLPTLGLSGDRDGSTPPDLMRETVDLVPGSTFQLVRGAGHLLTETHPDIVAGHVCGFLNDIGHR